MVNHEQIVNYIKIGTGCLIFLALTYYVIVYLKPSFEEIKDFMPYIALYFLGYFSKGGKNK